jgi:hypothetical protein
VKIVGFPNGDFLFPRGHFFFPNESERKGDQVIFVRDLTFFATAGVLAKIQHS